MEFKKFGISEESLRGLDAADYVKPTEIQSMSLEHSLRGRDILGAAKTGSGKTLAFLLPVLEKLRNENWGQLDGLGALVISPTRELALQIFMELRKVGRYHPFSAGLLIGGKDLKQEQQRLSRMNILVCTPGRLLQHMDQTPEFETSNLQILVLDEADRILDSGFQKTLNAIIEHLPRTRQTLLYSATQTKSVSDLARLSLKDPEYVAVHEHAEHSTPTKLSQKYMETPLQHKLDVLFSFIRTHLKQKIIVFLSSCKQVRFVFEAFCKLQPGIPLMHLHGRQKQQKRMGIFQQFCKKSEVCLFATDVAARGLDFPAVDWVVQADCPENCETYIHRVGRTARLDAAGQALLLLLPSEKEMVNKLRVAKVPIAEIKVNPAKLSPIKNSLGSLLSQSPDLKYLAQKAFICYIRSIYLQGDKRVFSVDGLPLEEYAESLGLPGAPKIKVLQKNQGKNDSRQAKKLEQASDSESDKQAQPEDKKTKTKVDRLFEKKNNTILSSHYQKLVDNSDQGGSDDELLTINRRDHELDASIPEAKRQEKNLPKKEIARRGARGTKLVFDEDGDARNPYELEEYETFKEQDLDELGKQYAEMNKEELRNIDPKDKEVERQKRRLKKQERKLKEKELRRMEQGGGVQVTLRTPEESGQSDGESDNQSDAQSIASHSELSDNEEPPTKKHKILDELAHKSLEDLALQLMD